MFKNGIRIPTVITGELWQKYKIDNSPDITVVSAQPKSVMFQKWDSNPHGDYRGVVAKCEIDNSPDIVHVVRLDVFPPL